MFYVFYALALIFIIFWCGLWILHFIAIFHAKLKFYRKIDPYYGIPYDGVSILKPLKGLDSNLHYNLESFFTLQYPVYELLFCFEESTDPAIPLVNSLIEKYPDIDAKVFTGGNIVGVNPKLNNMQPGYLAAKYDYIMISDSNLRMREETLTDMVQLMDDDVGIVHQLPFTWDREGFAPALEKIYFGTAHARIYLFADFMQVNCHTGMSTLIRKNLLDDVGGLQSFGCYLAEDFFIAKSIMERGWRTRISSLPALQNPGCSNLKAFRERLKRWTKLRSAMVPHTIILEPLSECLILGIFTSWAVYVIFMWDPVVFYLVHVLIWFLLDYTLLSIIQNGSLPFSKFYFIIGWLYREINGPLIFLSAFWDNTIKWRTRIYKLHMGGIAEEISPKLKL
ncbi:hypothetical protein PGB90_000200 [Kerria lacca]